MPRRTGGAGEGVHHEVRAVPAGDGEFGLGLEGVEQFAARRGVEPGLFGRAVDDLVGDAHERVDVGHVLPHLGASSSRLASPNDVEYCEMTWAAPRRAARS